MTDHPEGYISAIPVRRIEALTDGIFAIVMTLLVLTIDLPRQLMNLTLPELYKFMLSQHQDEVHILNKAY